MKKIILLPILFILSMAMIYATPQLTLITTTWQEGTMVNISTKSANDDSLVNMSNITIRFSASNTANSTSKNLINISNTTATNFDFGYANFTFGNSIILEDTNVGAVTGVSTGLLSGGGVALSSTTVIIDRTKPTKPSSLTTAKRGSGDTITATVTDSETTACYISFGLGGIRKTMTYATTTCTFTVDKDNPPDSIYDYKVYATDGRNETASDTTQIEIDALANPARRSPSSLQLDKGAVGEKLAGMSNVQKIGLVILVIVVLDMIFDWGIIFKKGK